MHESKTEQFLDRTNWPAGQWMDEPDRIEWRDEETNLPCLMLRHPELLTWCGYVGVPPGHRYHGLDMRYVPTATSPTRGGCMTDDRPLRERVCHVPEPGESDDAWWMGFDCAHAFDLAPGMIKIFERAGIKSERAIVNEDGTPGLFGDTYKFAEYVKSRVTELAHAAGAL